MKDKKTLMITTFICLLPIVMGLLLYDQMPAEIATHFDSNGVPDDYSPKEFAVFGLPVFLGIINTISHAVIEHDPRGRNQSKVLVIIFKWLCPVISVIINPCMYLIAIGNGMLK